MAASDDSKGGGPIGSCRLLLPNRPLLLHLLLRLQTQVERSGSSRQERQPPRMRASRRPPGKDVATLVQQKRIIVRTVDMNIVVDDVAESVDAIGSVAQEMGGWLVSSSRAEEHRGFVSVRVPAERLEEAILRLRAMAQDVKSEITSSRDVTDEYYDIQARLTNLEATEGALIKLLEQGGEGRGRSFDPGVAEPGPRGH